MSALKASLARPPVPPVINPNGMRRWRSRVGGALFSEAPIIVVGHSHVYGQNADGVMEAGPAHNVADGEKGWVGQLRTRMAKRYGTVGEGYLFPDDSRITSVGGIGTFAGKPSEGRYACLRHNRRFTAAAHKLEYTVEAGITRVGIIQANGALDEPITWSKNGVAQGNVSALTKTNVPFITYLPVVAGEVLVLTGVEGKQNTVLGFVTRTAQETGVPVHRIGQGGYTQGNMLGGTYSGKIGVAGAGAVIYSEAEMKAFVQSLYTWSPTKGLVILMWETNEQTKQLETGAIDTGVSPALYKEGLLLATKQIEADGWCTLIVSPTPTASENTQIGAAPSSAYRKASEEAAEESLREGGHTAFWSIGDVWGYTPAAIAQTATAGLRDAGSSHPTLAGYGDIAYLTDIVLGRGSIGN